MQNSNEQERAISRAEEAIARSFRIILNSTLTGSIVEKSDDLREALNAMEYFIPEVLREIHREWENESLDGVLPLIVRKTGEREVELVGQCILISDQTLVPIYVILQIHSAKNKVTWLECRLGEKGADRTVRRPYGSDSSGLKQLCFLEDEIDSIDWAYQVAYGEKCL